MPVLDDVDWAGAGSSGGCVNDSGRQRCSCLPFCFWGASSSKHAGAPEKRRRRRRRRLRFRLKLRLSWLAWPWFFRKAGGKQKGGDGDDNKGIRKRRGRRLLLLLTASLQPKKALASVVAGDSALLPAAKVSSFGDAKKQNNRKPRPAADDDEPSGSSRQPQASGSAATASTRWSRSSTAPAAPRMETSQPSPRPTDGPAVAGRTIWRAPSRRHSLHCRLDSSSTERRPCGAGGLWTAATTLGVIVFLGRVTAVVFLCSCLYGARFVRARLMGGASGKATSSRVAGGGSGSRRFGDPAGVVVSGEKVVVKAADQPCATEEYCKKKKVVMAGLLDRPGKTASSRFGR